MKALGSLQHDQIHYCSCNNNYNYKHTGNLGAHHSDASHRLRNLSHTSMFVYLNINKHKVIDISTTHPLSLSLTVSITISANPAKSARISLPLLPLHTVSLSLSPSVSSLRLVKRTNLSQSHHHHHHHYNRQVLPQLILPLSPPTKVSATRNQYSLQNLNVRAAANVEL